MKKTDITTTQNVTIEYQLAGYFERLGAYLLDIVIMGLSIFILYLIFRGVFNLSESATFYLVYIPIFFFYTLAFETFNNGQSLGKMALKIRVVKITGEQAGFFDYLMRWTFRMIDIYFTLGTLVTLTVTSSRKNQRIGDLLADTTVIKLIDANRFSLERILKIDTLSSYSPVYPSVTSFNEDEMLLIKETVDRYNMYPNSGHKEAVNLLVDRIETQLQVKAPKDKTNFLNTLIKDFVALTR